MNENIENKYFDAGWKCSHSRDRHKMKLLELETSEILRC